MSGAVSVGVAAIAIGTAVATDFATFAVIGAVGATLGAIGTIAKVPALQIAGAAIGVVGAVGGVASAAGAFGEGGVFGTGGNLTNAFGGASSAAPAGGFSESAAQISGTAQAASGGADNLAGLGANASSADNAWAASQAGNAVQWGGATNVVDQVNGGMTTAAAATSPTTAEAPTISAASGGEDDLSTNPAGQPGETAVTGNAGTAINPGSAPSVPSVDPNATPATGLVNATTPTPVTGQPDFNGIGSGNTGTMNMAASGSNSTWDKIFGFLKDNKTLVSGATQAIGSFASGMLNPLTPAQINLMNSQAKANQAAAARSQAETDILNMRASNMGQPIPVASRITGTPALGIVNSASPITGVPA